MRFVAHVVLASFLLAALTACGGGGGGGGNPPPPSPLGEKALALADRLVSAHLDNGAHDWRQNVWPYVTSVTGYQNVTGVTVLGQLRAYLVDPVELAAIEPKLHSTTDYLLGVLQDFVDDVITSVSLPNFIYLSEYRDAFGLTIAEWNLVEQAFAKLLFDRNATDGTDAGVICDGVWNRIFTGRAGIPGIRGWDLAFVYKALVAMAWPQSELDWAFTATVSLDVPPLGQTYGDVSPPHVLEIAAMHGASPTAAAWYAALQARIQVETVGQSVAGDRQATAYAVLALQARGEDYAPFLAWLDSEIGVDGSLPESDGYEYFEIMGEVLDALAR